MIPLFFGAPPASDISVSSLLCGFGERDWIADSFEPFIGKVTIEDFRGLSPAGAELEGDKEFCLGVPDPLGCDDPWCFFLCFFLVDSLPLVSDADI